MTTTFTASTPIEWLDIPTVERILTLPRADVLRLIQDGLLNARNVHGEARISSGSLDQYSATKPLFGRPSPETYVKVGNGYRLEV